MVQTFILLYSLQSPFKSFCSRVQFQILESYYTFFISITYIDMLLHNGYYMFFPCTKRFKKGEIISRKYTASTHLIFRSYSHRTTIYIWYMMYCFKTLSIIMKLHENFLFRSHIFKIKCILVRDKKIKLPVHHVGEDLRFFFICSLGGWAPLMRLDALFLVKYTWIYVCRWMRKWVILTDFFKQGVRTDLSETCSAEKNGCLTSPKSTSKMAYILAFKS